MRCRLGPKIFFFKRKEPDFTYGNTLEIKILRELLIPSKTTKSRQAHRDGSRVTWVTGGKARDLREQ